MDSLVDAAWLQAHHNDPELRTLDCTVAFEVGEGGRLDFYSGLGDWRDKHIPGSGFADIIGALSAPDSPHQFTLPSAERFAGAMEALGIGDDSRVVLYDSTYTMWATRVWWMLNAFGFENAAVLDGGLSAWTAAGGELTNAAHTPARSNFTARLRDGWFVTSDEVLDASNSPNSHCIIDALMPEMYSGKQKPYARAGHIPGAINVPAVAVVDAQSGLFASEDTLREYFAETLDKPEQAVITYCGGGIAATADAFLLRRLGKKNVAVYDGSMSQWSADANLPLVLGENPN